MLGPFWHLRSRQHDDPLDDGALAGQPVVRCHNRAEGHDCRTEDLVLQQPKINQATRWIVHALEEPVLLTHN